jgi:hypothetical protein
MGKREGGREGGRETYLSGVVLEVGRLHEPTTCGGHVLVAPVV